jgi:adenine-specific DNA glycosylase
VVDGNVYRVLSRIYGILSINNAGIKEFKALAVQLLDINNPDYNQAIMEFGRALQTRIHL